MYIFAQIFKYFALFQHFPALFLKNCTHALSRIGPDTSDMQHRHYFFLARSALPEFFITSNLVCYKQDLQNLISWMEIAFFISTFHSTSDGYTGPNAGWFSQQWLFMGKRKLMSKKLKTKNLFWINRRNSKTDSNIYI